MRTPVREIEPKLKCSFSPFWQANPYQVLLARALSEQGIDTVCVKDGIKAILADHLSGTRRIDVVHHHWVPALTYAPRSLFYIYRNFARIERLTSSGVRLIWTVHNLYPHNSKHQSLDLYYARRLARLSSALIFHSEAARERVLQTYQVAAPATAVIFHGNFIGQYPDSISPVEARLRLGIAQDDVVFCLLGTIRENKGLKQLLEAFREVARPGVKLLIAGSVATEQVRKWLFAQQTLSSGVLVYPEFVPDEDLQIYLRAADVMAFPYTRFLTSGALVLAMSFGKPCLAPNVGMINEYTGREGAFLYEEGVVNALVDALRRAVAERSRLPSMGARNFARAQELSWPAVARETAAVYRHALQGQANVQPPEAANPPSDSRRKQA